MEFSRQEYWSGLPFPSPGDFPDPGIGPAFPSLQAEFLPLSHLWVFPVVQSVKSFPAMQKTHVQSLGWEDTLEIEMATHSSILAWRIPWTEEPGGLCSPWGQKGSDITEWHIWSHMWDTSILILREFMKIRKRLQHICLLKSFHKLKKNQFYAQILANLKCYSNHIKFIQRLGRKKLFFDISILWHQYKLVWN